jgi:hypothetical protein
MKMVGIICGIHLWWGLSLLVGIPLPRPFGALEPFYTLPFASDLTVGLLLTVCGILPLIASCWPKRLWCISCLMVPQQMILGWGFLIGVIDVVVSHDGRAWYALGYTGILFMFHAYELRDEFELDIVNWKG